MNRERLTARLEVKEGVRLKPYLDTKGRWTIGSGRNLTDVGISPDESRMFLDHDINSAMTGLTNVLPWFPGLDDIRQEVLVEMCFNMGLPRLMASNPRMLEAAQNGNYEQAAREMLDGPWKDEVHQRAFELAEMMRTGEPIGGQA